MSSQSFHRLLRALQNKRVDSTPVWMMRQAGRYLPEYRDLRAQAPNFLAFCQNSELAAKATLQPLQRFPLDAAILFSDILVVPHAMGLELHYGQGEGPYFSTPIRSSADLNKLGMPDPAGELGYVSDTIRIVRRELNEKVPLIGFAGSPWTVAAYMVEGKGSKNFNIIRAMRYQQPALLHRLLAHLSEATVSYLSAQINAGVQAIMLFDTWGSILSGADYEEFSLAYMQLILQQLPREQYGEYIPRIIFTKGGGQWLEAMSDSGCDAIGIDWTTDLSQARSRVGHKVALQGNLDPAALYAAPSDIRQYVRDVLNSYGYGSGHVFNLGHGIYPDIPVEHISAMVDEVHRYSARFHL